MTALVYKADFSKSNLQCLKCCIPTTRGIRPDPRAAGKGWVVAISKIINVHLAPELPSLPDGNVLGLATTCSPRLSRENPIGILGLAPGVGRGSKNLKIKLKIHKGISRPEIASSPVTKSFPDLLPPPTPCLDSHGNHRLGPGEGGGGKFRNIESQSVAPKICFTSECSNMYSRSR